MCLMANLDILDISNDEMVSRIASEASNVVVGMSQEVASPAERFRARRGGIECCTTSTRDSYMDKFCKVSVEV